MAGTTLTIGVIATIATLTVGVAAVGSAFVTAQQASAAADAAALAASDVASGALPSTREPCAAARAVAETHGARLDSCAVSGSVATVTVSKPYAGLSVTSRARAGPPS